MTAHTSRSIEDRVLAAFLEPHYSTVSIWRQKLEDHLAILKSGLPADAIAWDRVIPAAEIDAEELDEAIAEFARHAADLGGEQSPAAQQLAEIEGALQSLRLALSRTITLMRRLA